MLSTGQRVKWNWGTGEAEGVLDEVFTGKVARDKGQGLTRKASRDNPACLIGQDDDNRVLMSASDVTGPWRTKPEALSQPRGTRAIFPE
ncbi:MAG: HVA1 family protein [Bosea sp.]|nr:HVA1 family protein [Bosea sp. (in: a-proteobacteria)]